MNNIPELEWKPPPYTKRRYSKDYRCHFCSASIRDRNAHTEYHRIQHKIINNLVAIANK